MIIVESNVMMIIDFLYLFLFSKLFFLELLSSEFIIRNIEGCLLIERNFVLKIKVSFEKLE